MPWHQKLGPKALVILLAAVLLLVISALGTPQTFPAFCFSLTHEIGFALLVSVIIWGLFELRRAEALDEEWGKRVERISSDVFSAVLRRNLPKDLINEALQCSLSDVLLRSNFNVVYTLKDAHYEETQGQNAPFVLLNCVVSFRISNVAYENTRFEAAISIPKPVHPALIREVKINSLAVTQNGQPLSTTLTKQQASAKLALDMADDTLTSVIYSLGFITLPPNMAVEFRADYTMAKLPEDQELLQTRYPSDGLTVTVTDHATQKRRDINGRSIHRKPAEMQAAHDDFATKIFRLPGYILPYQGILIWWKKSPPRSASAPQPIAPAPPETV